MCKKRRYFSDQDTLQLAALKEQSEDKRQADRTAELEKRKSKQHLINAVRELGHYPSDKENPTLARALREAKVAALLQPDEEAELEMFKFRTLVEKQGRSADEDQWLQDHPAAQRACNEATLAWARSLTKNSIAEHEPSKLFIFHKSWFGCDECRISGSLRIASGSAFW